MSLIHRSVNPRCNCFPYAPYELFTSSCLQEFETGPNPISRTGLVPIGILVSSTTTPPKPRSRRGHVCVRSSQVNHPSNMPATRLKLTEQDRVGDTHSEGLNGGWWHAKMLHPKPYDQIRPTALCERPAWTLCRPQTPTMRPRAKIQTRLKSTAGAEHLKAGRPAVEPRNNSVG